MSFGGTQLINRPPAARSSAPVEADGRRSLRLRRKAGFRHGLLKSKTSLPENVLTLGLVYGDGHTEEQGAARAVVVRN